MGFFSKIFGSASSPMRMTPVPEPTAKMMDEDVFWRIVQTSIEESGGDRECQKDVLVGQLERLEPADIVKFRLRTDKLLYDTYNSKFWCAGYLMNKGCSDDAFEYFRLWVISRGRDVFNAAAENPDSLVTQDGFGEEFYEFEELWYVALTAFKNVTGKELYDYINYDEFKFCEGNYPDIDFDWSEDEPESMKELCPNLFARFHKDNNLS